MTERRQRPLRMTGLALVPLALTACTQIANTGQTLTTNGITHELWVRYDPNQGATAPEEYLVFYRDYRITCPTLDTCPRKIAEQQHFIDHVYMGEPQ